MKKKERGKNKNERKRTKERKKERNEGRKERNQERRKEGKKETNKINNTIGIGYTCIMKALVMTRWDANIIYSMIIKVNKLPHFVAHVVMLLKHSRPTDSVVKEIFIS